MFNVFFLSIKSSSLSLNLFKQSYIPARKHYYIIINTEFYENLFSYSNSINEHNPMPLFFVKNSFVSSKNKNLSGISYLNFYYDLILH